MSLSCSGLRTALPLFLLLSCSRFGRRPSATDADTSPSIRRADVGVTPVNCQVRYQDGQCELITSRFLRLLVRSTQPFTRVTISAGQGVLQHEALGPLRKEEVFGGVERVFRVQVPTAATRVTVRVEADPVLWGDVSIAVRPPQPRAAWLDEADRLWQSEQAPAAVALLNAKLAATPAGSAVDQALAHLMLGRILYNELGQLSEARTVLLKAYGECGRLGIVSCQLDATLAIGRMDLAQYQFSVAQEAHAALQGSKRMMPEMDLWIFLQRADIEFRHGNFRSALRWLNEQIMLAERYQDGEALSEGHAQMAALLTWLGLYEQAAGHLDRARDVLEIAKPEQPEPCRAAYRDLERAQWLIERRRDLQWRLDAQHWKLWPKHDPRIYLHSADQNARQCTQPELSVASHMLWAQAELLDRNWEQAQRRLDQIPSAATQPVREHNFAEIELRGQLALGRRDFRSAEQQFKRLLGLIPEKARADDWFDRQWRALAGRAEALETLDASLALTLYEHAEWILDQHADLLPFGESRASFFSQYARGTARYLKLLYIQNRLDEALLVSRRAARRVDREYARANRLSHLSPQEQLRYAQALVEWRKVNQQLSTLAIGSPADQARELRSRRIEWNRKLMEITSEVLNLSSAAALDVLRPPQPDEALLICPPVPGGYLCLVSDSNGTLAALPERLDAATLNKTVLARLETKLRSAHHIRILARDGLPQLALNQLRFADGTPLEKGRNVSFSLDLSRPAAAPSKVDGSVLLLVDSSHLKWDPRPLERSLNTYFADERHVHVERFPVASSPIGLAPPAAASLWSQPQAVVLLAEAVAKSNWFVFFGHVDATGSDGFQPHLSLDAQGFKVSDVLVLPRVPQGVVLSGCDTGVAELAQDGDEQADDRRTSGDLGMAQAFVLRGSDWVIATVGKVTAASADALIEALFNEQQLGAEGVEPAAALYRACDRLRATQAADARSLDAFRVFQP